MWLRSHPCLRCCQNCSGKMSQQYRNILFACICGIFFTAGWWCFIDASSVYYSDFVKHSYFVVPGIGSSLAFIVVNSLAKIPLMQINLTYMSRTSIWCLRFILFIAFFVSFSMVITSVLLFSLKYTLDDPLPPITWSYSFAIPQTLLICIATFLFYFGIEVETF